MSRVLDDPALRAPDRIPTPRDPARVPPAAVLWDMDGTLIDTEPCWKSVELELVRSHGGTWSRAQAEALTGLSLLESGRVLRAAGVDLEPEEIALRMTEMVVDRLHEATFLPGALDLLAELGRAGVPSALVTASYRVMADAVVARAPAGSFALVVSGDEVTRGKPDPEPYRHAARALGVDPRHCVAIEDSPPGITAALASGARTLGVRTQLPVPPRPGLSRVPSLVGVTLADLTAIRHGALLDRLGD